MPDHCVEVARGILVHRLLELDHPSPGLALLMLVSELPAWRHRVVAHVKLGVEEELQDDRLGGRGVGGVARALLGKRGGVEDPLPAQRAYAREVRVLGEGIQVGFGGVLGVGPAELGFLVGEELGGL